jgi:CRP-like cAMP-binding protein
MSGQTFKAGQTILRKGDASDIAYLVESGEAEVLDEQSGREVRVAILGKGHILGDMGLVEQRTCLLTARAVTEVRAAPLTREAFLDLILQHPEKSLSYLRAVFARLRSIASRALQSIDEEPSEAPPLARFKVTLTPLTDQLAAAIPEEGITIRCSPFRVGRAPDPGEATLEANDLVFADSQPYTLSRKHFSIEIRADGVFVQDRGSHLGTIVNGKKIGGNRNTDPEKLRVGENEISAGAKRSPFRFRLVVQEVD